MSPGSALLPCGSPATCVAQGTMYGYEAVRAILDGARGVLCA